jgi:hypothetical protein
MKVWMIGLVCLAVPFSLGAQKKGKDTLSGYDKSAKATIVHDALVYVDPDDSSQKVSEILPGHEFVVIQRNGPWVKVFANTDPPDRVDEDQEPEFGGEQANPDSGWIKDKGIVQPGQAGGDEVLFGTAAIYEAQAAEPHGSKDAASEAKLLYRRVYEYFPESAMAGEAAFRSADIRWQMEKADNASLPSAKEQDAYLRPQIYEGELKRVMKNYAGSKWAMLAAYDLLDNKLCGDWQGLPHCPEMEINLYLRYAAQYKESPKAAEAYYNAVFRQGVLVTMYQVDGEQKRADEAVKRTVGMAEEMKQRFGEGDWTARAASVAFRVKQGVTVYGSDRE